MLLRDKVSFDAIVSYFERFNSVNWGQIKVHSIQKRFMYWRLAKFTGRGAVSMSFKSFMPVVTNLWLALVCIFLSCVLIFGRVLILSGDEVYFLSEAFSGSQAWIQEEQFQTDPYGLFKMLLGFVMVKGEPSSLWIAIILDNAMQIFCLALLLVLGLRWMGPNKTRLALIMLSGVLFYWTIGRLAEHRPDYLSVTVLTLGFVFVVAELRGGLGRWSRGALVLAGALFTVAIAVSPRALVVLALVLPGIFLWACLRGEAMRWLLNGFVCALGSMITIMLLWLLLRYSLIESFSESLVAGQSDVIGISLSDRLTYGPRLYLFSLVVITLVYGVYCMAIEIQKRGISVVAIRALSPALVLCILLSIAQIFLIVLDTRIHAYGYSYGLGGFIALIIYLARDGEVVQGCSSIISVRLSWIIAVFFMLQVPQAFRMNGYHYNTQTSLSVVNLSDAKVTDLALAGGSYGPLIPRVHRVVTLCERFAGAEVVADFFNYQICLRNGYPRLLKLSGSSENFDMLYPYPGFQRIHSLVLQTGLLTTDDLKQKYGVLFVPEGHDNFILKMY